MAVLVNTFDGGTNNATITLANSGGLSGDALSYVSGNPVFSNAQAHSGALSARCPASAFTAMGLGLVASAFWVRVYVWLPQHRADSLVRLWSGAAGSGNYRGGIDTKANGNLDLVCGGATVNAAGSISLSQWIRVEARFSTTSGAQVWLYTDADSDTPAATASTAANLAGAVATQDVVRATTTTAFSYIDDFAVSDEGPIGPAVDPIPRPAAIASTAVHRASRW